jgi:hypothetical protein
VTGITAPVIAGLAAGIALIFAIAVMMWDVQQRHFYVSNGNPQRTEFQFTGFGWVLLETRRLDISKEYYDYNREVIEIMLRNSTVAELLNGQHVLIVGMGPSNCAFGECAVARLTDMQDRTRVIFLTMDYDNGKVTNIRTDGW